MMVAPLTWGVACTVTQNLLPRILLLLVGEAQLPGLLLNVFQLDAQRVLAMTHLVAEQVDDASRLLLLYPALRIDQAVSVSISHSMQRCVGWLPVKLTSLSL